jgi:hypothetical protein
VTVPITLSFGAFMGALILLSLSYGWTIQL